MKTAMNHLRLATAAVALTIIEIVVFAAFLLMLGIAAIALGVVRMVTAVRRAFAGAGRGPRPQLITL